MKDNMRYKITKEKRSIPTRITLWFKRASYALQDFWDLIKYFPAKESFTVELVCEGEAGFDEAELVPKSLFEEEPKTTKKPKCKKTKTKKPTSSRR